MPASATMRRRVPVRTCLWSGTTTLACGSSRRRIMWLPLWRRNMKPARSRAALTSRPERSIGSLATTTPLQLRGLDFDEFLADLSWDRIPSVAAVLDVKLNSLADIGKRFSAAVTLADTSCQRWDAGDVAAV